MDVVGKSEVLEMLDWMVIVVGVILWEICVEVVIVDERLFDEVRDGGEDVNDGMLEEFVIIGFIMGFVNRDVFD